MERKRCSLPTNMLRQRSQKRLYVCVISARFFFPTNMRLVYINLVHISNYEISYPERAGRGVGQPSQPPSSAEVLERVELYLYSL